MKTTTIMQKYVRLDQVAGELNRFLMLDEMISFKAVDDRGGSGCYIVSIEVDSATNEYVLNHAGYEWVKG